MKIWKRRMALILALVLLLSTGAMAAGAKYSSWFAPYYKEMFETSCFPVLGSLEKADFPLGIIGAVSTNCLT